MLEFFKLLVSAFFKLLVSAFFKLLVTDEMLSRIAEETILYAAQYCSSTTVKLKVKPKSRASMLQHFLIMTDYWGRRVHRYSNSHWPCTLYLVMVLVTTDR